jgi:hypothetical protein
MESQDTISASSSLANAMERAVLPEAVGPAIQIKLFNCRVTSRMLNDKNAVFGVGKIGSISASFKLLFQLLFA